MSWLCMLLSTVQILCYWRPSRLHFVHMYYPWLSFVYTCWWKKLPDWNVWNQIIEKCQFYSVVCRSISSSIFFDGHFIINNLNKIQRTKKIWILVISWCNNNSYLWPRCKVSFEKLQNLPNRFLKKIKHLQSNGTIIAD